MRRTGPTDTGWRLLAFALAWLGGVGVQLQQAELWSDQVYPAALACGAAAVLAAWRWHRHATAVLVLGLVGALVMGLGASGWRAGLLLDDGLPGAIEGRDITVTGVVATLPQVSPSGLRFRFDVESATAGDVAVRIPAQIALGWYNGFHEEAALSAPQQSLRAGQRWRFTARLRQPHGNANPNGYDVELMWFEQGVRATGSVRAAPVLLLERAAGHPIERLRQRVRDSIYANVGDRRAAGVLAALSVGDQGAIEREDWDLFRNAGVAHLMSISGLHVTMFAWLAGLGLAWLWRRSGRLMLLLPTSIAARWGGFAAAFAYALFSGWGVPSQRTVWMLATVTLLQSVGVRWPWLLVLAVAAVIVTVLDPWALLQAGFWLSFMAVGLLMVSSPATGEAAPREDRVPLDDSRQGWRLWPSRLLGHARDGLRTQLIATLGLTPLTLVFFNQVSVIGFVANLFAIPLVTLVITPLALLGVFVAPLWNLGAVIVDAFSAVLGGLASWSGAVWVVPVAPLWARLAGLVAAALLVLPLPWRARLLALPLAIALLVPPHGTPREGRFDLTAADIGQGTAVIVRTHAHVLVFDTGPQYSTDSDAGQRVLVPLLRTRGDDRVDRLVLSHRDSDHIGGARSLMKALPVGDLWSSLEPGHPLLALATRATRCEAGQQWVWDGVRFDVLSPMADEYAHQRKSNALSCVLRVSGGGRSALLTGDIEKDQEASLVARYGATLQSEVLMAPHHGSRTSSTAAFLDAVRPSAGVFQAGYCNRFGHPAADVVARYRERGAQVVASPSCGAWQWPVDDAGDPAGLPAPGLCWRHAARRYWHHRVDAVTPMP